MINTQFYNVKTRQKVDVPEDQVQVVTMKNGKKAAQAVVNGVKMFRIISKDEAEKLSK